MSAACPDALVTLADELADAAGGVVRRYFRTAVAVDGKADSSPVTIADREAEAAIRDILAAACPDHGIFGEEYGRERIDAEFVWVIDPIDGTKSFVSGVPLFGTLIALLRDGRPVLGVIDQPILRERWVGVAGRPTTLNGEAIRTRACPLLADATLTATSPDMFRGADRAPFERLRDAVRLMRYGYDCYGYAMLASGFVDVVVEASLQPYDYCALVPVIEGAGGVVTDWQGSALSLDSDGRLLCAGDAKAHAQALDKISA